MFIQFLGQSFFLQSYTDILFFRSESEESTEDLRRKKTKKPLTRQRTSHEEDRIEEVPESNDEDGMDELEGMSYQQTPSPRIKSLSPNRPVHSYIEENR